MRYVQLVGFTHLNTQHKRELIMLMHSMQQRNKELAAKFNLLQPDLTHLWENYTSQGVITTKCFSEKNGESLIKQILKEKIYLIVQKINCRECRGSVQLIRNLRRKAMQMTKSGSKMFEIVQNNEKEIQKIDEECLKLQGLVKKSNLRIKLVTLQNQNMKNLQI